MLGVELEADAVDLDRPVQGVLEALHGGLGGVAVGARHEHGKFVAAEARDEILAAERRPQPRADLLEHEVTVMVTEGVVDLLEAVKVDEQEPAGAERLVFQRLPDGLEEPSPVRQLGEAVVASEVLGGNGADGLAAAEVHADERHQQKGVEDRAELEHGHDHRGEAQEHRAHRQAEHEIAAQSVRERGAHVQGRGARDQQQVHDEVAGRAADHDDQIKGVKAAGLKRRVSAEKLQHKRGGGQRERVLPDVEADLPPRLAGDRVLHDRREELCHERRDEPNSEQQREREHHRDGDLAVARTARRLDREQLSDHHAPGEREELDRPGVPAEIGRR